MYRLSQHWSECKDKQIWQMCQCRFTNVSNIYIYMYRLYFIFRVDGEAAANHQLPPGTKRVTFLLTLTLFSTICTQSLIVIKIMIMIFDIYAINCPAQI